MDVDAVKPFWRLGDMLGLLMIWVFLFSFHQALVRPLLPRPNLCELVSTEKYAAMRDFIETI